MNKFDQFFKKNEESETEDNFMISLNSNLIEKLFDKKE